jgi:molybdate transport system permease protein
MLSPDSIFAIRLSAQVAVVATLILIVVTIPIAHFFARRSFPGKRVLETLFLLPLVLPPTVLGYYLVVLFGRHGLVGRPLFEATGWTVIFSWWGAVIAAVVVAFPLLFQSAYAALAGVDCGLEQTAYTLGKSKIETFRRITIPLASRGLLSGIALAFARAMGEFGATLMLAGNIPGRTNTMPLTIYSAFAAGRFDQANVLAAIYAVFCVLLLGCISMLTRRSFEKNKDRR